MPASLAQAAGDSRRHAFAALASRGDGGAAGIEPDPLPTGAVRDADHAARPFFTAASASRRG